VRGTQEKITIRHDRLKSSIIHTRDMRARLRRARNLEQRKRVRSFASATFRANAWLTSIFSSLPNARLYFLSFACGRYAHILPVTVIVTVVSSLIVTFPSCLVLVVVVAGTSFVYRVFFRTVLESPPVSWSMTCCSATVIFPPPSFDNTAEVCCGARLMTCVFSPPTVRTECPSG